MGQVWSWLSISLVGRINGCDAPGCPFFVAGLPSDFFFDDFLEDDLENGESDDGGRFEFEESVFSRLCSSSISAC